MKPEQLPLIEGFHALPVRRARERRRPHASSTSVREVCLQRVATLLRQAGAHGLTDEEMQRQLAMDGNTQRPRRGELVAAGEVVDSGRTRRTRSGGKAAVWVWTDKGTH